MVTRVPPPEDGSPPKVTSAVALLLVVAVAVGIWLVSGRDPGTPTGGDPEPSPSGVSGLPLVDLDDLPPEAAETVELIDDGGPFPYDRDGVTFENREGLLPDRDVGYYAEYTVPTPGSDDRGPRRIVTGDDGELYWTADHYRSFEEIVR